MKTRIISCLLFLTCALTPFLAWGQENKAKSLEEIPIRDPYILPDKTSQTYYLYASDDVKGNDGKTLGGLAVYESIQRKGDENGNRTKGVNHKVIPGITVCRITCT